MIYLVMRKIEYTQNQVIGAFTNKKEAEEYLAEMKEFAAEHETSRDTSYEIETFIDGEKRL